MKRSIRLFVCAVIVVITAECVSSYVLYRDYAYFRKALHPLGMATAVLLRKVYAKLEGRHDSVLVSAGSDPVFRADPYFGFAVFPGAHKIVEHFDNQSLMFHLTIDDKGRRVTSYRTPSDSRHLYIIGDSLIFGWGLDDEETMPWLLQTRLPTYDVENLSLNTYSTIHALLQLRELGSNIHPDDIIVLSYHEVTNDFNVADPETGRVLLNGYELQVGEPSLKEKFVIPFGALDEHGNFSIRRIKLSCFEKLIGPDCVQPALSEQAKILVTERAFDEVVALHLGKVVVAFEHGPDSDPVVAYLKSKGIPIADVRMRPDDANFGNVLPTNNHAGPYRHHQLYLSLLDALQRLGLVE